jgi:predicted short-subunit dehydrogenase-like oxidoreductase (DUF2520 family)
LQTFSRDKKIDFNEIPCFITAASSKLENRLYDLASKLTDKVEFISDEQRKVLHLAAVFANNFTNHLYSISKDILLYSNLKFDYLLPLIKETTSKIAEGNSPEKCQTGPAVRNDLNTIEAHLKILDKNPEYKKIYELLTKSIIDKFNS